MTSFTPGAEIEVNYSWEPVSEQETSFIGGKTQSARLKESFVEKLYHVLCKETGPTAEVFYFDHFELKRKLYYKGKSTSLMIRGGKQMSVDEIVCFTSNLAEQSRRRSASYF